jgi:hypothetical protein
MKAETETTNLVDDCVISRADHGGHDPELGPVEKLYRTCTSALVHLWKSRWRLKPSVHNIILKKDVANLRLWEENFPPGHLDTVLAQSSRLKSSTIDNLRGMGNILSVYLARCNEDMTVMQNEKSSIMNIARELEEDIEVQLVVTKALMAGEESDSSSDGEFSYDSSSSTEHEQNRHGRLHCYVNCLMDLAPVLERQIGNLHYQTKSQPAGLENGVLLSQSALPLAVRILDRCVFSAVCIQWANWQNRFPTAPVILVERLAEAHWKRYIQIRGPEEELLVQDQSSNHGSVTMFKPYSMFHDPGLGASNSTISNEPATVTPHTSLLSTREGVDGRPRVPPLPQETGIQFHCDYCQKSISMRDRTEWKCVYRDLIKTYTNMRSRLHVFADLQSYLCTHAACKDAMKTFPSRALWAAHEFNEHFTHKMWHCFVCHIKSSTEQSYVDHLVVNHDISLREHRLTAAISEAEENVLKPGFNNHKCALCSQAGWQTRQEYATHVGQHLEEISLACFARTEEDFSQIGPEPPISTTGYQTAVPESTRAFSVGLDSSESLTEAPELSDFSSLAPTSYATTSSETTDLSFIPPSSNYGTYVTEPDTSGLRSYYDFSSIGGQEEKESFGNAQQYGHGEYGAEDGLRPLLQEMGELFDEAVRGTDFPDTGLQ